jgi:16S rRNA processing protein RimM
MPLDDYYEIGFILKPHGLKGAVSIQLDVDQPAQYQEMESVIVRIGENLVPFFISSLQISGDKGIMQLEDIINIEAATELKSCALMLPTEVLPKLEDGKFYFHEVIGYQVVDEHSGPLGIIENVLSGGNQDLISMKYKGVEVLIPIADDIVLRAEHATKQMMVKLPDGLLEIYLQ